jgi:hypothetical protein
MATKVVHCKKDPFDVYIGRPSKWGNPFVMSASFSREDVIDLYRKHFLGTPSLLDSVSELKDKTLGCFCAPQACHGDVLAEYADA